MRQCSEVKILSILTAIFQAIGQALTFILPISESGHSAIFHDFSARYSGESAVLTGLIHIGVALGIAAAYSSVFLRQFKEFFGGCKEIAEKKFDIKKSTHSREFTYYTVLPFFFMPFYLIPIGSRGNVYQLLISFTVDGNLISEGVCFLVTAVLLLLTSSVLKKEKKGKALTLPVALLLSLMIFVTLPLSGLSLSASIICVAIICGVNRNFAFRYFVCIAVPVLLVMGIVEVATSAIATTVVAGALGVVIAAAVSFLACRFLKWSIKNIDFKFYSYYNFALAALATVTGIVELITNK